MPRPSHRYLGQMTAEIKRWMFGVVGSACGEYEFTFEPRRATRTGQQNKYFHAVIVERFHEFLRDQDYEHSSRDAAKAILKQKFLVVDDVNPETGEVIGNHTLRTRDLDIQQMADLIDRCTIWLEDKFGIIVEPADPAWRREAATTNRE